MSLSRVRASNSCLCESDRNSNYYSSRTTTELIVLSASLYKNYMGTTLGLIPSYMCMFLVFNIVKEGMKSSGCEAIPANLQ